MPWVFEKSAPGQASPLVPCEMTTCPRLCPRAVPARTQDPPVPCILPIWVQPFWAEDWSGAVWEWATEPSTKGLFVKKKNQVTGLVLGLDFNPDRLVLTMTCLAYLQVQLSWSDTGLGILCQHEVLT